MNFFPLESLKLWRDYVVSDSARKRWAWKTYGIYSNPAGKLSHFIIFSEFQSVTLFPLNFFATNDFVVFLIFIIYYWTNNCLLMGMNLWYRNKRLCIDLSCWMVQLQNVSKSHSCLKDKVYLQGLFHRLRALLSLNCNLIFVTGLFFAPPLYPFFLELSPSLLRGVSF